MATYELTQGYGDLITCDQCSDLAGAWYTDGSRAICQDCGEFYLSTEEGESK